jgi:hyperosmotically inducible protein
MVKKSLMLCCAFALLFATGAMAQTDSALTASVKTRLAADDLVKATAIDVSTDDHVVTLEGTVATKAIKDRAIAIARQTKGVTTVVDELKVAGVVGTTGSKTTAEKAAAGVEKGADKSADAVGKAAGKTAKAADKSKSKTGEAASKTGEALETAAKKTGEAIGTAADKTAEAIGVGADKTKEATEKAADKTAEKTRKAGSATSDAAITAAVKSELLGDGKTPGLDIDVDTDDGVVTLEGEVTTAAQRATALRLARETKGVTRVVDKITVAK